MNIRKPQKDDKKINFILVDDELNYQIDFDYLINKYNNFNGIGYFYDAQPALDFIKNQKPDVIFLDMYMPKKDGMDFLAEVDPEIPVVIISTYQGYAIKSYNYNVIDYIEKPIKTERFNLTINKILKELDRMDAYESLKDIENRHNNFFYLSKNEIEYKIYFGDVEACVSKGNYINIIREDGIDFTFYYSLIKTHNLLKNFDFIQINKSTIISKHKIKEVQKDTIVLQSGRFYKLSESYRDNLLHLIKQ